MDNVTVTVGEVKYRGPTKKTYAIQKVIVHERFNKDDAKDIALLMTSEPIVFNDLVQPACYPDDLGIQIESLQNCWITGWALTNSSVKIPALQKVHLFQEEICYFDENKTMICMIYNAQPKHSCTGDNGGPLVCQDEKKIWLLFGITSFRSKNCNKANIFVRTAKFIDWVKSKTAKEGKPFFPQGLELMDELEMPNVLGGGSILQITTQTSEVTNTSESSKEETEASTAT